MTSAVKTLFHQKTLWQSIYRIELHWLPLRFYLLAIFINKVTIPLGSLHGQCRVLGEAKGGSREMVF